MTRKSALVEEDFALPAPKTYGEGAGLSNSIWRVALVSVLLVPACFYCFYGHAAGRPFTLSMFVATLLILGLYLGVLRRKMRASRNKEDLAQLSRGQSVFLYFAVVIEVCAIVCAAVHYARHHAS